VWTNWIQICHDIPVRTWPNKHLHIQNEKSSTACENVPKGEKRFLWISNNISVFRMFTEAILLILFLKYTSQNFQPCSFYTPFMLRLTATDLLIIINSSSCLFNMKWENGVDQYTANSSSITDSLCVCVCVREIISR